MKNNFKNPQFDQFKDKSLINLQVIFGGTDDDDSGDTERKKIKLPTQGQSGEEEDELDNG